jgi:hypothetical protein
MPLAVCADFQFRVNSQIEADANSVLLRRVAAYCPFGGNMLFFATWPRSFKCEPYECLIQAEFGREAQGSNAGRFKIGGGDRQLRQQQLDALLHVGFGQ